MNVDDLAVVNRAQIQRAGARYTPGLDPDAPNIEVEGLARALAFLGTHPSHRADIRTLKNAIENSIQWVPKRIARSFRGRKFTPGHVAATLERLANAGPGDHGGAAGDLRRSLEAVQRTISQLDSELSQQEVAANTEESRRNIRNERAELRGVMSPILDIRALVDSPSYSLLTANAMLLIGEWGTGKTHSLCDVSEYRMRQGLPTLF